MYRDHTVAAVVPAYNESGFVGAVIDRIPAFVDRAYVIEDGSTDDTWEEINRHAAERNDAHDGRFADLVVPIQHEQNRGVGGAIKTGYQRAREERIDVTVVLGGDDQMDPDELTRYIDPIVDGVAEYTKGNRFARPEDRATMPRFRLFGNVVLSYLTKIASGYWGSMDSQNGYTAISLSALERADIDGMYEYYGYCNDLLVRLNVADVRIADVTRSSEYAYSEGWKSHIDYKEYIPRVSGMLFRSFGWRLREKYMLESYNPLAFLYPIGISALTAGGAGLANALFRRNGDGAPWFISMIIGSLLVLYAGVLDRAENEHLEREVGLDETGDVTAADDAARDLLATLDAAAPEEEEEKRQQLHPDGGTGRPTVEGTDGADGSTDKNSGTNINGDTSE